MAEPWSPHVEKQLISALEDALQRFPNLAIRKVRDHVQLRTADSLVEADAIVHIEINGRPEILVIEAKNTVFPRDARETIWQLRGVQKALRDTEGIGHSLPLIVSRSLSEGAKSFLQSENVGYYEEGGSLYLADPNLYIFIDKPPSKRTLRTNRSLFSSRRSQVVHALLQQPHLWYTVKELSIKASVSAATVSQVLIALEKREWMSSRGSGPQKQRQLRQPGSLLDEWTKQVTASPKPRIRRFFVPSAKPEELMHRIDDVCKARPAAYTITGEWAAQIYSPFLSSISQVRCRVPSAQTVADLAHELNAREVHEGSNLALLESQSDGDFLFREQQRGVWLASPIIVYLDLLQGDGRAKEMAGHLRQERIHF